MKRMESTGGRQERGLMDPAAPQTNPLDHPTSALGLVEIQPGAVVSRTLINLPCGTVTLFAFDAGEELSEHTAPYSALLYGLQGEVEVRIAGKAHELHPGELLKLPAKQPHSLRARSAFQMMLTMIRE
jgi:quercetin dioxygenase-like cupin family protein